MRPVLFDLPFGIPLYAYGLMLPVSVIVGRLQQARLGLLPSGVNLSKLAPAV